MNRAQALHDAQQIGASLLRRVDPPLDGVPIAAPRMPDYALPPNQVGERACRAFSLTVPPGGDVFALFATDWAQNGAHPVSWSMPEGPVLVGTHPAGFVLVLRRYAGRDKLYVVSPVLSPTGPKLYGGIAVGASIGLVGPCFSTAAFQRVLGENLSYLGFVPVVLLLGGFLLLRPDTRQLGVGLLIGAAITGIVTAGLCASMLA